MFRRSAFLLIMAVWLQSAAFAAATEIASGIVLVPGEFTPGTQPDGNSIILTSSRGLIVFDTGRHHAHTQALLDFAEAHHRPITDVINSHWHLDHTGGNLLIRQRFPNVQVHASAAINAALDDFLASYAAQLKEAIAATPRPSPHEVRAWQEELILIDSDKKLAPDHLITSSHTERVGGRKLSLHLEKNVVTAGDVWALDPSTGTLLAGDLVTPPFPFLDTACPSRWKEALDRLSRADFKVLIPGHGAPMSPAAFNRYRAAFDRLLQCGGSAEPVAA